MSRICAVGQVEQVAAVEHDAARRRRGRAAATRRITDSDSTDLPQPDSPTMPSVRPRGDGEVDAVHRGDLAARGAEDGAQAGDGEQVGHVPVSLEQAGGASPLRTTPTKGLRAFGNLDLASGTAVALPRGRACAQRRVTASVLAAALGANRWHSKGHCRSSACWHVDGIAKGGRRAAPHPSTRPHDQWNVGGAICSALRCAQSQLAAHRRRPASAPRADARRPRR